jgi:5'-3' exonuclease
MSGVPPRTVHLVDASIYIFRAWFTEAPDITDADGDPVNAVHGFARFLLDLLERSSPTHVAVAFDESLASSFRNELYPAYKANREPAPPALQRQFEHCKQLAAALGLTVLADTRYEADDLIGSAAVALRAHGFRAVIVSADKDFGQLIGDSDEQWDPPRNLRWNHAGVKSRLGIAPAQVADFLALCGDAIDNIPGVPGIGRKTAAVLLGHFGSLEALLARAEEVAFLRLRGAARLAAQLREHAENVRLFRALTAIALDAPVPLDEPGYCRGCADVERLEALAERLRFGALTRTRLRALAASG